MPQPSANPTVNMSQSSPQPSADNVPRHASRMLSPPSRRGSSALSPLPAPPRRSSLVSPAQSRASARSERMAAALERGFVTAKVLHMRDGGPLADFIGPLAPERYMSLPKGSKAMGKALIGVAMKKGLQQARRLETFRRSGSVRGGKRSQDEVEQDEGWFGAVSRALMGEMNEFEKGIVNKMKVLKLGKNSGDTVRTAHIPLECLDVSSYKGVDYRSSMQPKVRKSSAAAESQLDNTVITSEVEKMETLQEPEKMEKPQEPEKTETLQEPEKLQKLQKLEKTEGSTGPMEIDQAPVPEKIEETKEVKKNRDLKEIEKVEDMNKPKAIGTGYVITPDSPSQETSQVTDKKPDAIGTEQNAGAQSSRNFEPISTHAITNSTANRNSSKKEVTADCGDLVIDGTQTAIDPIENLLADVPEVDVVGPLHSPTLPVTSNQKAKQVVVDEGKLEDQSHAEKIKVGSTQPESGKDVQMGLDIADKTAVPGSGFPNNSEALAANKRPVGMPMVFSYDPSPSLKADAKLAAQTNAERAMGIVVDMEVDSDDDEVGDNGQKSSQDKPSTYDQKSHANRTLGKDQEKSTVEIKLESSKPQGTVEFKAPVAGQHQPSASSPGVGAPTSPVKYTVRKNIPKSILEEMVEEMEFEKELKVEKEKRKQSMQSRKSNVEDVDIVNIDADDDAPKSKPVPFARPRKVKRRRSMMAQRMEIEEKRESLRNRVVAAMSTEPGSSRVVKQESRRGSYRSGVASGSTTEKLKAKRPVEKGSQQYQRRSSRRLRRRSLQPLVESSQSEKSSDEDDDDYIAPVDNETLNSRERARSAGGLVDNSASHSDPDVKELVSARQGHSDHVTRGSNQMSRVHGKAGKRRGSSSPEISQFKGRMKKDKIENDEEEAIETGNSKTEITRTFWERELNDLDKKMRLCESPDLSSSSDDDEDGPSHEGIGIVARLVRFHSKNGSSLLDNDQFDEHHEMMSHYRKTRSKKDSENKEAKELIDGTDYVLNQFRESAKLFREPKVKKFRTDTQGSEDKPNEAAVDDGAEETMNGAVNENISKVMTKGSEDGEMFSGREFRARDLYERVVSGMEEFVDEKAKELLKRWAERDHSWFDKGSPIMEVAVVTTMKQCKYCDAIDGKVNERCEESILIKLWDNMTWRKLRRMRHRVRSVSNRNE